ncbi:MAG: DUF6145 family protein [Lachnospiraceae bacterium]
MEDKTVVLCGASRYEEKYYFNPAFKSLPEDIRKELQIMCVLYTQEIGGVLILEFDENGNLELRTEAKENDFSYDEIGGTLRIKELRKEKQELFEGLEMYYRVVFLGEHYEES